MKFKWKMDTKDWKDVGNHTKIMIIASMIALFIIVTLSSCNYDLSEKEKEDTRTFKEIEFDSLIMNHGYYTSKMIQEHQIVEIDGCEYIVYTLTTPSRGYGYITHKGNCKNPIHKHNK